MDNENLQHYLKVGYPEVFEGWDGYELEVRARMKRVVKDSLILVILLNEGEVGHDVDIHASFLIMLDAKGNEVIRVSTEPKDHTRLSSGYRHL